MVDLYRNFKPEGESDSGGGLMAKFRPDDTPGANPENPVQEMHPRLSTMERAKIMNLAPEPATGKRRLEEIGFEVTGDGWDMKIRQRGEKGAKWHAFDPKGFDWRDILDIPGDVAEGVATGVGAVAGAGAGIPSGPGAIATGMAGAGLAAYGARNLRTMAGAIAGLSPTQGEAQTAAGESGAYGALSVPVAAGAGWLAKGALKLGGGAVQKAGGVLKTPERWAQQYTGEAGRLAQRKAEQAAGVEGKELQESVKALTTRRGGVAAKEGALAVERGALKRTAEQEAAQSAEEAATRGAAEIGKKEAAATAEKEALAAGPEAALKSRIQKFQRPERVTAPPEGLAFEGGSLNPVYGIKAKHLQHVPDVVNIMHKNLGARFRNALGSEAMEEGDRELKRLIRTEGFTATQAKLDGYYRDLAELIKSGWKTPEKYKAAAEKVLAGKAGQAEKDLLNEAVAQRVRERVAAGARGKVAIGEKAQRNLMERQSIGEEAQRLRPRIESLGRKRTELARSRAALPELRKLPETIRGFTRLGNVAGDITQATGKGAEKYLTMGADKLRAMLKARRVPPRYREGAAGALEAFTTGGQKAYERALIEMFTDPRLAAEED